MSAAPIQAGNRSRDLSAIPIRFRNRSLPLKVSLNGCRDRLVYRNRQHIESTEHVAIDATIIVFNGQAGTGPAREEADVTAQPSGDARAFESLMKTHERRVFNIAWRLLGRVEDAQDAAQEVFLRLYRYLDRYDTDRPLEPWLYRVTVNVCHDLGRRRAVREAVSLEELEPTRPLAATTPDPGASATLAEEQRIAEQAIATLAEKERTALVLRDVQGLSTAEVAEILDSSQTTVRSQICRARLKIKKFRDRKLGRSQ